MAKAQKPKLPGASDAARIKELSKKLNDLALEAHLAVRDAELAGIRRGKRRGLAKGFAKGLLCGALAAGLAFVAGGAGVLLWLGELP